MIGAIPIGFKAKIGGQNIKIYAQYTIDGKVEAEIVDMDHGGVFAVVDGTKESEKRAILQLTGAAINTWRAAGKFPDTNYRKQYKNDKGGFSYRNTTDAKEFERIAKDLVKNLTQEVKKENAKLKKGGSKKNLHFATVKKKAAKPKVIKKVTPKKAVKRTAKPKKKEVCSKAGFELKTKGTSKSGRSLALCRWDGFKF